MYMKRLGAVGGSISWMVCQTSSIKLDSINKKFRRVLLNFEILNLPNRWAFFVIRSDIYMRRGIRKKGPPIRVY